MNTQQTYLGFWRKLLEHAKDGNNYSLFDKLEYLREAQLYELITQVEESLIKPRMDKLAQTKADPTTDATLQFFKKIRTAIYQCGEQNYIVENLNRDMYLQADYLKFLMLENARYQAKLAKYETLEEMQAQGTLEMMVKNVREQMTDRYKLTQKNHG